MKFYRIFPILAVTLLCSCNGSSISKPKDHFVEYKFKDVLSNGKISEIKNHFDENINNLSKIIAIIENYYKSGASEELNRIEGTGKFFEDKNNPDLYIAETKAITTTDSLSNGLEVHSKEVMNQLIWTTGTGYVATTYTLTKGKDKETNTNTVRIKITDSQYKYNNIAANYSNDYTGYTFYEKKDGGYICIQSNIDETRNAVQWGTTTKEYITKTKFQSAYLFDKKYFITEMYEYSETSSNRDSLTGEWFNSVIVTDSYYVSMKYEYGKRENKSVESLNKTIDLSN